jgi:hypothetical protein
MATVKSIIERRLRALFNAEKAIRTFVHSEGCTSVYECPRVCDCFNTRTRPLDLRTSALWVVADLVVEVSNSYVDMTDRVVESCSLDKKWLKDNIIKPEFECIFRINNGIASVMTSVQMHTDYDNAYEGGASTVMQNAMCTINELVYDNTINLCIRNHAMLIRDYILNKYNENKVYEM